MKNLKDDRTKILPSTTRGGKELPSSSALDSPSVISKLATPKPATAMNSDMTHVIDDATSAMNDTYDGTTSMLDTTVPLGEFLDEQLARVRENEIIKDAIIDDSDDEGPPNDSVLHVVPKGYVMNKEAAEAILACNDRNDLKKLLAKWKQQSLNPRMKPDPTFATSTICVTDKDYEFSADPDIITLVESDPFYGLESKTVVAHLTKLNDIAPYLLMMRSLAIYISLRYFRSH